MNSQPTNPISNKLGFGVNEKDVLAAITQSGYPLQTFVARELRQSFQVEEEWSYIDKDSKEQRTLDLHARRELYDIVNDNTQPRVRPTLDLLIECKQSDLPYIFFPTEANRRLPNFPPLAGLPRDKISILTDDNASSWTFDILHALGLNSHPFISAPPFSSTFSKCVRKGKGLELSGSESYSSLVLPILKSVAHFLSSHVPSQTIRYFDAHLVIALGVVDAPMMEAVIDKSSTSIAPVPWVRVTRHESVNSEFWRERTKLRAIDIVHKDFLTEYLERHLMPFANAFAALAEKHQLVLIDGEAFVPGMARDPGTNLESRMKRRSLGSNASRVKALGTNVLNELKKR